MRSSVIPSAFSVKAVLGALIALSSSSAAFAQGGDPPPQELSYASGSNARSAGDVNGDGIEDLVVGDIQYDQLSPWLGNCGRADVLSGADGSTIWSWFGTQSSGFFGSTVEGVGDVNADGFDDVLVSAMSEGHNGLTRCGAVYLYSGADGSQLAMFSGSTSWGGFGTRLAPAGDYNADGHADFLIGDPWDTFYGGGGAAFLYSGSTMTLRRIFVGDNADSGAGWAMAPVGDRDGDGTGDFAIGFPGNQVGINYNAGVVRIISGLTGVLILEIQGPADWGFGQSLASGGDFDGDGQQDLLIGELRARDPQSSQQVGRLHAYSLNGTWLAEWWGGEFHADEFGKHCLFVPDLDGDGFDEVLTSSEMMGVAAGSYYRGAAFLYQGGTGVELHRWEGSSDYRKLGVNLDVLEDMDGDGRSEMLIGIDGDSSLGGVGAHKVWSWNWVPYLTATATEISSALGGTIDFALDFPDSEAGRTYLLVGSGAGTGPTNVHGVDVPLTADWLSTWMTSGSPPPVFQNSVGVLDSFGDGSAQLNLPPGIADAYIGTQFHFAAVSLLMNQVQLSSVAVPLLLNP